jgi:diguanylate cyclase (GGDEF)-like protein/PAS domain S-box-containing protein
VTPTFRQRLGLDTFQLPQAERRALVAARAASLLFAVQSVLAIAAAAAGGALGPPVLVCAATTSVAGLLILLAYERLPWIVNQLLAAVGVVVVAALVLVQPEGDRYALLFVAPVIYVSFFFRRRNALAILAVVTLVAAGVLGLAHTPGDAAEMWILAAGALVQAAGTTIFLRRSLLSAVTRAKSTGATLDAFFLHSSIGFAFLDRDLRHVRVNEPLAQMLGTPADRLVGQTIGELAPHLASALEPLLRRVLETGEPAENLELASRDGRRHYLVSYYTVVGPNGMLGLGETVVDVTHLKDVERRLEDTNRRLTVLATTDELTGLPNRRMFGEQLELALARARRHGTAAAVLCLDLDRFKDVNDSLGHAYGDDMLVEVARRLRAGARETDVVARLGGDEFVILLADLDVQKAAKLAQTVVERIRRTLAEPLAINPVELKVDASIGVAIFPTDSRDPKGLLALADAAMYAGKSALERIA